MTEISTAQLYERQLILREIGGAGQQKLAAARVLIVGMGGLGCPVALYLAAAGLGTLGLMDPDQIEASNLSRQILYGPQDIGRSKAEVAAARLADDFPTLRCQPIVQALTPDKARAWVEDYDIVADCLDNFASRLALSDACAAAHKPLVSAAAIGFRGELSTFKPYQHNAAGDPLPTYRCWVGDQPSSDDDCRNFGVLGSVVGTLGTMQATEIIKEITGAGESLAGRILFFDGLSATCRTAILKRDPSNIPSNMV